MWIQLLVRRVIELQGIPRTFFPGDWADVGKYLALQWIAQGEARTVEPAMEEALKGGGVVLARASPAPAGLPSQIGRAILPYEKTLLWDPELRLPGHLLAVGFGLLDRWEMAAPIASRERLASSLGTEQERAEALGVLRDLRVPYYDTRLIFVRRTPWTERMIAFWGRQEGNEQLAFLKALYLYKPIFCALPTTWAGESL